MDRLVRGIEFLLQKAVSRSSRAGPGSRTRAVIVVETPGRAQDPLCRAPSSWPRGAGPRPSLPRRRTAPRSSPAREALAFAEVPKSLLVVGAGAIGLEMGSIYRRLGTEVTVLELLPGIMPGSDRESAARLERVLKKQGLKILTEMSISAAEIAAGKGDPQGDRPEDQGPVRISRPTACSSRPAAGPTPKALAPEANAHARTGRLRRGQRAARDGRPGRLCHRRPRRRQAPGPQGLPRRDRRRRERLRA